MRAGRTAAGAYAVSKTHLGTTPSLVAAASLTVDYILNAAVGVSAGVEALAAAYPSLYGARVSPASRRRASRRRSG